MSAQPCGCDSEARWVCSFHADQLVSGTLAGLPSTPFTIKDSGKREEFSGGMIRDTAEGKINYALVADGPMLKRWAEHLTKGAKKYAKRNWMKAEGQEEYERARESAFRHFMQWFNGETDEDHASAVFFNINETEYLKLKGVK
jgi:hypothetical protein